VKATLATAKNTGRKRVPACSSRTAIHARSKLKAEFGRAFHHADVAVIADVYPASELPIEGVSGQTIVDEMIREGHEAASFQPDRKKIPLEIGRALEPGDVIISLGAGNIHEAGSNPRPRRESSSTSCRP